MNRYILLLIAGLFAGRIVCGAEVSIQSNSTESPFTAEYSVFANTMADMTWPEIERAVKNNAVVLLPLGVIEEHGPHIACGADVYQAYHQCRLIKSELEQNGTPAVIVPPFYWGVNYSTRNFPGSFDIKPETMKAVLNDILQNLQCWGFQEVYAINCHGEWGHNQAILDCVKEAWPNFGIRARWVISDRMLRRYNLQGDEAYLLLVNEEPPPGGPQIDVPDFHAGAQETGDMIAFFPDLVNVELAKTLAAPEAKPEEYQHWGQDAQVVTPLGYAGNPSAYDAEWSKRAFNDYYARVVRAIKAAHEQDRK